MLDFSVVFRILDCASLILGSTAALLFARAGIVNTAIIAQFIFGALAYAYFGSLHFIIGILMGFAAIAMLHSLSIWSSYENRRTYILFLYVLSLFSIPAGDLIMRVLPGDPRTLRSPGVAWTVPSEFSLFVAAISCVVAAIAARYVMKSREMALLQHWSSAPPSTARDLQIANVYSSARLVWASTPITMIASGCVLVSIILGCFAQEQAYVSGKYNFLPFWMLMIGLVSRGSITRVVIFSVSIGIADYLLFRVTTLVGSTVPPQMSYIIYGALFLLFSSMRSANVEKERQ